MNSDWKIVHSKANPKAYSEIRSIHIGSRRLVVMAAAITMPVAPPSRPTCGSASNGSRASPRAGGVTRRRRRAAEPPRAAQKKAEKKKISPSAYRRRRFIGSGLVVLGITIGTEHFLEHLGLFNLFPVLGELGLG